MTRGRSTTRNAGDLVLLLAIEVTVVAMTAIQAIAIPQTAWYWRSWRFAIALGGGHAVTKKFGESLSTYLL